jgi:hypothetical protein
MAPEDVVAEIAAQTLSAQGRWLPIKRTFANFLEQAGRRIEELGFADLKVKLRSGIDGGNWKQRGEAVFAALADHDKPVVLAIDELPILVNRMLKGQDYRLTPERRLVADEFLGWLRKAAQAHRDICLIISGSISLEPILRQAGLSAHANVYSPFELKPWSETTAANCLAELAANYQIDLPEDVRRHMCRMLRCCVPHHVQQFFDYLHEELRRVGRRAVTPEDVDRVYEVDMLGIRGAIDLDHYQSRLAMVLGSDSQRIAIELLTEAAVNQGLLSAESIAGYERYFRGSVEADLIPVVDVLLLLEHDGYLVRARDGYRFVSRLVEDWWRARFGMSFVPLGRRELDADG